jgi:hypothetical protein
MAISFDNELALTDAKHIANRVAQALQVKRITKGRALQILRAAKAKANEMGWQEAATHFTLVINALR